MDRWLRTGSCSRKPVEADPVSTAHEELSWDTDNSEVEAPPRSQAITPRGSRATKRGEDETHPLSALKIRKYDPGYVQWGFVKTGDESKPRALCVLCGTTLMNSSLAPAKLHRHLKLKHPGEVGKSRSYFEVAAKDFLHSQAKIPFKKPCKWTEVSLRLSYEIGRAGEAHTLGERVVKPSLIVAARCLLSEKQVGIFQAIPLSNNTVSRRIADISSWLENKVCSELKHSEYWAMQLDESTDVSGLAVLMVFIRYVYDNEIKEEPLLCKSLPSNTTGEAIFETVDGYMKQRELSWKNCLNICTDAAAAMVGRHKGFVSRVKQVSGTTSSSHCMLHREALVAKQIAPGLGKVLDEAVKIVNHIKTRPLQSRIFKIICEEMGSEHTSLLLHTEIRWLSRGRVLCRVFELRNEILMLSLDYDFHLLERIRDNKWLQQLAYLADIFAKLNELNLSLQGKQIDIFQAVEKIRTMKRKMDLWVALVPENRIDFFPTLQDFLDETGSTLDETVKNDIVGHVNQLRENFERYFPTATLERKVAHDWINKPFVTEFRSGLSGSQNEELIQLQNSQFWKNKFAAVSLTNFWASAASDFPSLAEIAQRILVPFVSTYRCETAFSIYASTKHKRRNRLDAEHDMRLQLSTTVPDFENIVVKSQNHPSH